MNAARATPSPATIAMKIQSMRWSRGWIAWSMTAPVIQSGPLPGTGKPAEFVVAFVLPAGVTAENAPAPTDPRVTLRAVPGSLAAAVRFSGSGSAAGFARHNKGLQAALTLAGLVPVGPPRFARFDPPFKPWFLRRNEVIQDVGE